MRFYDILSQSMVQVWRRTVIIAGPFLNRHISGYGMRKRLNITFASSALIPSENRTEGVRIGKKQVELIKVGLAALQIMSADK